VDQLETSPVIDKIVDQIIKNPKAKQELDKILKQYGVNPESLNEDIDSQVQKLALAMAKKAETLSEGDYGAPLFAGLFGGGILAQIIARSNDVLTPMQQLLGQSPSHMTAAVIGMIAGAVLAVVGKKVYDKVKGLDETVYDDIEEPEFDDDHDIEAQKKFEDMIVDIPRLHQLISSSHHRGKEVTINGVKVINVTGIGNIFLENGEKLNSKEFANGVPDIKINGEPIDIPMMSSKPPAPLNYKSSDVYPPGSYMDEVVNKALKEHRRKQK
jgi:cell division protein FtsI/penicillin-binding protein 2